MALAVETLVVILLSVVAMLAVLAELTLGVSCAVETVATVACF